jgi:uracil-DNA glycosylase
MSVTTNTINLEEIQQKLYEKLKPSGWADVLKTFLLADEFKQILHELHKQSSEKDHFTPKLNQLFRAFECCPYDKLKVVIIGQDPYPKKDAADGIAFSCSNLGYPEASLRFIFAEIEKDVHKDGREQNPDLKRWSEQGILMLNTALTTQIKRIGQHHELWKPFIGFLLDTFRIQKPGLVYVFLGAKAQEWMRAIPDQGNHKLKASHPASAAYQGSKWNSQELFPKISALVEEHFKETIVW